MKPNYGDVTVTVLDNFVAVCEINRAPNIFFDQALIADLANAFEAIDQNPATRAIVLCSQGKHFCAGANFGSGSSREAAVYALIDAGYHAVFASSFMHNSDWFANDMECVQLTRSDNPSCDG